MLERSVVKFKSSRLSVVLLIAALLFLSLRMISTAIVALNTSVFDTVQINTALNNKGSFVAGASITTTDVGTQNDYNPTGLSTATILRLNPASALTITGIAGGQDGRVLLICNVSTSNVSVTLANENASSTAINRLWLENNSGMVLSGTTTNTNTCALTIYDGTSTRWRLFSYNTTNITAATTFTSGLTSQNALNLSTTSASLNLQTGAHLRSSGTSPSVSACGTSPSIVGGDTAFRVTVGTTASNACTITFQTAYSTNPPVCVVKPEGSAAVPQVTISTTAVSLSSTVTDSGKYDVVCIAPN